MKSGLFVIIVSIVLVLLFSYTGISKMIDAAHFKDALRHSPLLTTLAPVIALLLPATELLAAVLLLFPQQRKKGLYLCFGLLICFVVYLTIMLLSRTHLPCSCGGVIQQLSWQGHLILNAGLLVATTAAIRILEGGRFPDLKNKLFIAINRRSRKPVKQSRHNNQPLNMMS